MRFLHWIVCCIFCCLVVTDVLSADVLTQRGSDQIDGSFLGVQSNLNYSRRVPNDNDYAIMDSIASTGVKWVRYWLSWYQVEVDSGEYYFTAADSAIEGYVSRGINVFLTLFSGNQWYDGPDSTVYNGVAHPEQGLSPTPGSASMQGWLNFVDTAVVRYGDRVKYWDIWNEPNIDFWQPVPNAQDYAFLLKETSQLIKSIDPSAKVIGLGTSTIDFGYISDVLQEDVIDHIDYLGFHPYRIYPEDDQDNMGLPYPPAPYTDYEEELQGLLDTLAQYDTTGRVQLWDEEAGYPSQPEIFIWTPDTIFTSEATQAKYLLRRYIMNLGFNVGVTTWFYDWDQVSSYPSILGPTWYQHYYNMNLYEKEVSFPFSFLGLTYSAPADTLLIEAEAYDSLYPPLKDGGTYIYTDDGDGDVQGNAVYFFSVADPGLYTVWLRMRNPDETAAFIVSVDDTVLHWVTNAVNTGTGTEYIWSLPLDSELIRWHYLYTGRHFFNLNTDVHRLRVRTGLDGASLDKVVIKREGPALTVKPAYYALQNLAAVFDNQVISDAQLETSFENIDVPSTEWDEFRSFAFRDTSQNATLVSYWLGQKIIDDMYPVYNVNVTVYVDSVVDPKIINFLDGSVISITDFTTTDSTVTFDSLPVSDYPYCVLLNYSTGIVEEQEIALREENLFVFLNPFKRSSKIEYSVPAQSAVSLEIYSVIGQLVRVLVDEPKATGLHSIRWDGTDSSNRNVPAGVYFCKLEIGDSRSVRKMILLR